MKKLTTLFIACLSIASVAAQKGSIKGTISDTFNKINLANSVVSVLRVKDSVLVKFTRSDSKGHFELKQLPEEKFLVMITYPSYADYIDHVDFTTTPDVDLGSVRMTSRAKLLADVTVRQKIAAIRLRGDTIEYKADSFKVSAGASVEEMLRKLPGLQVDKDGNVTAQGTRVEKVLVDGEEFFGDDPTMATKNLQADAIDKVQVFDKKSDQAVFTGIDDGLKTKTINLTLKEEKKKGYFGKLELKGGLENRWSNTAMINSFKKKRKLSGYGIMSSTGATGLNWQDREKYGEGSNMEFNADEGYFMSFGTNDEFDGGGGTFYGEGIPKSYSAGINYGNKFNNDKQNLNGSYRYNGLINQGSGNTLTQSILPDTVFYNKESRDFYNNRQRHSLNGTFEIQLDSFSSIKAIAKGYTGTQRSSSVYNSQAIDGSGHLVNTSRRNNFSDGDNGSFNSNFIFRKRFKKAGRTISLSFDEQYKKTTSSGFLFSVNDYYGSGGQKLRIDTIDQKKINSNTVTGANTRLAYTEPVIKNTFLELSYGLRLTQSEAEKLSYNKTAGSKYETLDPLFSNHYNFRVLTNTGGVMIRYNTKKYNLSGGGDVGFSNFRQTDLIKDTVKRYNFTNLFPRANFQYKFNTNSRISFNYNGNTRQPTIEQIQPVRDNSNSLNIAVGNPNLKQEFRHSFSLNYNFYKVLSQRGLYTYVSFNKVDNAISTNEITSTAGDSIGKRIYQYINVNGNYNAYSGGGYSFKISKLDLNVNTGFNINVSHNNSVVNSRKNTSDNNSYGFNFSLYKYKEKKFNVGYNGSINYNTSVSSIRANLKNNYYSHNHNLNINITLPKKFEFNTSTSANFRQKVNSFDQDNDVILINGYIGRKLLKNDKAMIRLEAYDILDQNKGYNRYFTSNILRENTYETLRRYFLLSFVWNFSKTPAGAAPGM